MHENYSDITDKLGTPIWFDEYAVPRYCEFSPDRLADIYSQECVLLLIACQSCGHRFKVAISTSPINKVLNYTHDLSEDLDEGYFLNYGDPPNVGCCGAGPSMSSDSIAILEYWHKEHFEWKRNSKYEKVFEE